jgi:hypothetical protein
VEIDIKKYTKHEAVMDLLATSPSFLLVDPIVRSHREFTLLYKEARKLNFFPTPTIKCKVLTDVIKRDQWSRAKEDTNSVKILTAATSDIIVASLAKSSSRAPRDSHCVEFSLQTSRHLRPEPRKIIIALLLLLLLLLSN